MNWFDELGRLFCSLKNILLSSAARNIYYNIVGGLLTVPLAAGFARLWQRWHNKNFKRIFGPGKKSFVLCYGSLIVQPAIIQALVPMQQQSNSRLFPFAKSSFPNQAYSASNVGSGCELRGSAYIASALRIGGIEAKVAADESIRERLDIDFISFGYANNLKTLDLASNDANSFVEYDYSSDAFVSKTSRQRISRPSAGSDYGIILRIHPRQFPERTWICCAGYGEWGTSGTAWFLGNKWRQLASRLDTDDAFLAVIKVKQEQDESAVLTGLFKTPEQLEQFLEAQGQASASPQSGAS